MELIPHTILLRVYGAGICRCDHITSLQGYVEEEIMDLLEIWLGHDFGGIGCPIEVTEVFLAWWMGGRDVLWNLFIR